MGLFSSILGGSKQSSSSKPATVWQDQAPYLSSMYGMSQDLMRQQMGYAPPSFDQSGYDAAMAKWNAMTPKQQKAAKKGSSGKQMMVKNPQTGMLLPAGPNNYGLTNGVGGTAGTSASGMPTREQFTSGWGNQAGAVPTRFQDQLALQDQAWRGQIAGGTNPFASGTEAGNAMSNMLAGGNNPYLTGMAANAMNQISRQFQEQIMPSLLGGGNAAGQLGGGRYQMLQDSAVRAAAEGMGNAANQVYGQAYQEGLKGQQAGLGMIGDQWRTSQGLIANAIDQGGKVMGGQWIPLMANKDIVGSPTVLGGSSSSSGSSSGGLLGGFTASMAL